MQRFFCRPKRCWYLSTYAAASISTQTIISWSHTGDHRSSGSWGPPNNKVIFPWEKNGQIEIHCFWLGAIPRVKNRYWWWKICPMDWPRWRFSLNFSLSRWRDNIPLCMFVLGKDVAINLNLVSSFSILLLSIYSGSQTSVYIPSDGFYGNYVLQN